MSGAGRPNQRHRTRKALLEAASRLMAQGRQPSLEEAAGEALVSRATAYRYFTNVDSLLLEAALDVNMPDADTLLSGAPADDPIARMERIDSGLQAMIAANEPQLRTMLAHSLQPGAATAQMPRRQNRRTALIDAALAPVREQFTTAGYAKLRNALALVIGTEATVVCKDVLELSDREARQLRRWAIRALVDAARKTTRQQPVATAP
jgi:AcrR family transcriptional regulator